MTSRDLVQTFLHEAEDLLGRIEEIALELDPAQAAGEAINQLFRAFHTLKGSGAMFGFEEVAAFTHHVETVLDQVRDGRLSLTGDLVALMLQAKDHIAALLSAAQEGGAPPTAAGAEIVVALNALLPAPPAPATASTAAETPAAGPSPGAPMQSYRIHFRPDPDLMVSGTNPRALLDELRALGDCEIVARTDAVPPLEQLQADGCYLAWDITLTTAHTRNTVKDVFIFVEDGSELRIEPVAPDHQTVVTSGPAATAATGAGGRENRATSRVNGEAAPSSAAGLPPPDVPLAREHAEPGGGAASVSPAPAAGRATPAPPVAPNAAVAPPRKSAAQAATVRVPSERLDRLVNLVGELVMTQSRLTQVAAAVNGPNLAAPVEELERLVAELRDNVLGIRMMPIGTTFGRFKRLVHDLSLELGKDVELVTEGAETELDKRVLDQLGDPLVHLIRNSLDHGIEAPDERLRLGKSRRGTIVLTAAHVGSSVVITIRDDGRGIDAAAVRAKAVERNLISAAATPTERELYELIFLPGFSTAKQVTGVSGRGVGMDVVKRQFDALRGQIALTSTAGRGTTLTLTLPLTLAIIDGLLVEIGRDQFIIPMAVVTENVELTRAERHRHNGRNVVPVRGELIPYVRLREAFALNGDEPDIEKIVITRHGEARVGLVVDRVFGSHQTVIQALGRFYRNIELLSGCTIMGDGRVALILDVGGLVGYAERDRRLAPPAPAFN